MKANADLVKLAVDVYRGSPEKYSLDEARKALYDAIVEINGGTNFGYKEMRDAQYNGLFALIEEIIPNTVVEGLQGDELFNTLIEFRNVAEGDSPVFEVDDVDWYEVSRVAHGSRGLRRQRLGGHKTVTLNTELRGIRIYEPMRRLLANRVDFNQFINRIGESWRQNVLNDCYTCWAGLTAEDLDGSAFFPAAGTYDEDVVLDVVEHVEAASGKNAVIFGTGKAIRNLAPSIQGTDSKSDLYNMGLEIV